MSKKLISFIALLLYCHAAISQTTQEWRDSLSTLNTLIERHPKSLELRMRKAEANIMLDQWYYALDEYTNILDLYPTHIGALYFRAFVNNKLKKYAFARQDYEKVLSYEPEHQGAITGLIYVNLADGHMAEAFDQANHLVNLYPDKAEVYAIRSQVEESREMKDLAFNDICTAIDISTSLIPETQRLSYNNDLTQYVLQRIALCESIGDEKSMKQVERDKKMLISRGIPSKMFK